MNIEHFVKRAIQCQPQFYLNYTVVYLKNARDVMLLLGKQTSWEPSKQNAQYFETRATKSFS
jgi:hypothetical protein